MAVLLLSFGFMLSHKHDHENTNSCSHSHCGEDNTSDDKQHPAENCSYCFLYYSQAIDALPAFHWESQPGGFNTNFIYPTTRSQNVVVKRYFSKGLRAPPLDWIS